uniref:HTH La-type RNA-binding domain-containing protein n=1 Tax=Guillardia theta TaxID=55529 RepID=A0A7S4NYQ7_GUITH|mmetsp:Transcript_37773/g.119327  ORF Transcript_37773/g.119327 Transcript_37773/m.119327 type:complete len:447 (+) Transcript_37773:230-1570(+)
MATSKEAQPQNGAQDAKNAATKKLEGEELKEAIKKQVEYYFSRENLCQDTFLVSKMDAHYFVDLAVIADFQKVKHLTEDSALILESVKDSDKVVVDTGKQKIKPVALNARTTLILRNIPTSASEDAVRALITGDKWPKIVNVRSDVGDNWFVSYETEECTKSALELAKGLKWEGKSISCAIKSESLLKSLAPGSPPKGGVPNVYYGPTYVNSNGAYFPYPQDQGFMRQGRGKDDARALFRSNKGCSDGVDGNGRNGGKRNKGKGRNNKHQPEGREGHNQTEKKELAQQAPINLADFPKLEGSSKKATGYSKPYKSYSKDEIVDIIRDTKVDGAIKDKESPFLETRDLKMECDKTADDFNNQTKHAENKNGHNEASNNTVPSNDKTESKDKSPPPKATPKEAPAVKPANGDAPAPAPAPAAPAPAQPKKLSYAQMANGNRPAAEAST